MDNKVRISGELLQTAFDEEATQKLVNTLLSNSEGLKIFKNLIDKRIEVLEREVYNKKNYESPSWAFFQADLNGGLRQLTELSNLLQFTKDS